MTIYNQFHINHFNPYQLINYLKTQNIKAKKEHEFLVQTQFIEITPDYIMSMSTGEIKLEIPKNDSIMDYLEYIPAIHLATKKESEDNGWDPPPLPPSLPEDLEYDDFVMQCGGCFSGKGTLSYITNGVRIHTRTMEKGIEYGDRKKSAEIIDAISGKVTDQFYGSWNDFNMTLVAKVSKGDKFFLFVFEKGKKIAIQQADIYALNANFVFRSNKLGEWRLIDYKELGSIGKSSR